MKLLWTGLDGIGSPNDIDVVMAHVDISAGTTSPLFEITASKPTPSDSHMEELTLPPISLTVTMDEGDQIVTSLRSRETIPNRWNLLFDDLTYTLTDAGISGVEEAILPPIVSGLHQNFPNPFNPQTTIAFDLQKRESVSLRIFDLAGRLVSVLVQGEIYGQGRHEVIWNGRDHHGRVVSAGVYFYRIEAGDIVETRRMMLLK